VAQFSAFYIKNKGSKNYVLGFSYGAMIAAITAKDLRPDKLYLCSLSPYFEEDLPYLKKSWRKLDGKRRLKDFTLYNGKKVARSLKMRTVIFYGSTEARKYPRLEYRCEQTARLAPNAKLIVAEKAPHDLNHPIYLQALKKFLSHND
jgi:pimeloyl-ACP methyl ester carboxylesterase